MIIDLFTFITGNSANYAEYLKYTAEKHLSGIHKINWKCVESLDVNRLPDGFECVCKTEGEGEHNSMKHALAIEGALNYIDGEYILLADSDIAIVYPGWDDVLVQKLNEYDCFGGAYADTKSRFSRNRYKKFPKPNFFSFKSKLLEKVELDFRPFRNGVWSEKLDSKKWSNIFGIPVDSEVSYDIGWKIPIIFNQNGLTSYAMRCYYQNNKRSKLPYLNEEHRKFCHKKIATMEEWHYNGQLYACHKKHARYNDLTGQWGSAWKTKVDLYIYRGDWYEKEEKKFAIREKRARQHSESDCCGDEESGV